MYTALIVKAYIVRFLEFVRVKSVFYEHESISTIFLKLYSPFIFVINSCTPPPSNRSLKQLLSLKQSFI